MNLSLQKQIAAALKLPASAILDAYPIEQGQRYLVTIKVANGNKIERVRSSLVHGEVDPGWMIRETIENSKRLLFR
jgi:hypothetical protein